MEGQYKKERKISFILKKIERCLSLAKKENERKGRVAPSGCLSVYVGPHKQRFLIKTEFVNHPLFKILLEDAELEYGFTNKGPLLIPCEVDLFCKVLAEMDCDDSKYVDGHNIQPCGFSYGSCSPFNPGRRLGKRGLAHGCGSHWLQTPPQFLKINHF